MAAKTIANLAIKLSAGTGQLQQDFNRAVGSVNGFSRQMQSAGATIGSTLSRLVGQAAALAGVGSIGGAAGWGLKLAADAEQAQIAFEVMFGSAEKAKQTLAELKEFGKRTPFEFAGLRDSAKTLAAFGIAQQDLLPTLKMLGDVAAGDQRKLDQLAMVYGQIASAGRLMGQDLLQLINVGFNPLQKMSERTGESMLSLKKKMEAGQISFAMVAEEFQRATSAGGMFFGMTERMGTTLAARWSTLKDSVAELALAFGETLMPAASKAIDVLTGLTSWVSSLDGATVANTAKIVAFGAAWAIVFAVIPKVVAAFRSIVAAYRAIAAGQAIVTALTGPAGWLRLAASASVAAIAVGVISTAFDGLQAEGAEVAAATKRTAEAVNGTAEAVNGTAGAVKSLQVETAAATADLARWAEQSADWWDKQEAAASRFGKSGGEWQKQAEQLTRELETPGEKLTRQLAELQSLFDQRLISGDIFERGNKKVRDDYEKAAEAAERVEESQQRLQGVAAIQQGSSEDLAAIDAARRVLQAARDKAGEAAKPRSQPKPEEPLAAAGEQLQQAQSQADQALAATRDGIQQAAAAVDRLRLPNFGQAAPAIAGLGRALDQIQTPGNIPGLEARAMEARGEPVPFEEPITPALDGIRDAGQQFRDMVRQQQALQSAQAEGNGYLREIRDATKADKIKVTESTI